MNPYETSANAPYVKQMLEAKKVIEEQLAFNRENYFTQYRDHVLTPKKDNDRLGYWAHPIVIKDKVVVDTRSFLRNNGEVSNAVEHTMCLERAIMEYFWQTDPAIYEGIADVLTVV